MAVRVYADNELIYDSRLPGQELLGLSVELGEDVAGTATLVMPPDHPAIGSFTSYRTEVNIYRDAEHIFRGRALYPHDDFLRRRTITCEGERNFLRDGVARPYKFEQEPAVVFRDVLAQYNAQVEAFKQFRVGRVTVTDPSGTIKLESESAEYIVDTIDKLVERCGGYITFTTAADGVREINWLAAPSRHNNQLIELGENLLDFSRSGENTDLATVIMPYGAKDETTGAYITIESANGGLDYIKDDEAVQLRGWIAKPVYWDDITDPALLLAKAKQYLAQVKQALVSLELTAVDLSVLDKSIDSFRVGDTIHVRSKPHGVDDDYRLTERKLDLLNPANDTIVLGKSVATLTGADAAGDRKSAFQIQKVERSVTSDYQTNATVLVEQAEARMASLIQQTSEALTMEVSEQYATNGALESAISTSMTQLSDSFTFLFNQLQVAMTDTEAQTRGEFAELYRYIRFEDGNIVLGETGNELVLRLENDRISFLDAGLEVAYLSNHQLTVLDGNFLNSLQIGAFRFLPRANGNLSLVKVGG